MTCRLAKTGLTLAISSCLSACTISVNTSLFVTDMIEAFNNKPAYAVVNITIPTATSDKCQLHSPKILESLLTIDPEIKLIGCIKDRLDDYASFETKAQIVLDVPGSREGLPGIFAILVDKEAGSGCNLGACQAISFSIRMNQKYDTIRTGIVAALDDSMISRSRTERHKITIQLSNDARQAVPFSIIGPAFVNGEPKFVSTGEFWNIKRRETVKIVLSDVASEGLISGYNVEVGSIVAEK